MKVKKSDSEIVEFLKSKFGSSDFSLEEMAKAASEMGYAVMPGRIKEKLRVGYGKYNAGDGSKVAPVSEESPQFVTSSSVVAPVVKQTYVPEVDENFVPFGCFKTVESIIKSKMFYPIYITGLSGNGKTLSVEQACAKLGREMIRVNFTIETDADDLIGGLRLVNGNTDFHKGPVIQAMERGAVLLLDEIDLANTSKVMALQSIMEGKGYLIKKTGEYVSPAPGFNIIATANTKGRGSDDGRFIGTNVLNEAFLERFPITIEQEYPSISIEKKIIGRVFDSLDLKDDGFVTLLVDWADIIRRTFYDGGVDDIISTRRLVHIAKAYKIFGDRMTAIEMCINRFDEDVKSSFKELYAKLDETVSTDSVIEA